MAAQLGDTHVFVVAQEVIPTAYFDIAAARRAGEVFAAMFLIPDRRAALAYELSHAFIEGDYDRRRFVFDAIGSGSLNVGGRVLAELNVYETEVKVALADVSRIPDALVVRSWTEAEAHRVLRGYARPHVARWYPARDLGVWTKAAGRDLVIVWAPDYPAEKCAIHTFALHDLHAPVVVVCRGGQGSSKRARYVDVDSADVPGLLSRALCIVDTSLDDPSWTQAFAARGMSVASATTSGAHEVADGVALYEPWSYRSIWAATAEALGSRASAARESPPSLDVIHRALEDSRPRVPEREPLVSIIIPTYNRRKDLARILRSVTAQSYANLEVLVVNDAGESVADFAGIDPRISVIEREVNQGTFAVMNYALDLVRGQYVVVMADDDEVYPDHLMRLVEALERTGASVAHSNVLIRFEKARNGEFQTTGYNCSVFCFPLDRTQVFSSSPVAGQGLMFRRTAFERIGKWDVDSVVGDQEIQIRLAEISDFTHVPHVTAEWLLRDSGAQMSRTWQKDVVADMKRVFERHPAPGRPYVEALRKQALERVASRPPGDVFTPTVSVADWGERVPGADA